MLLPSLLPYSSETLFYMFCFVQVGCMPMLWSCKRLGTDDQNEEGLEIEGQSEDEAYP